jgi:hypothetical protein
VSFCTASLWIARQPLGWISPLTSVKTRALFDVWYELSGAIASDIGQREKSSERLVLGVYAQPVTAALQPKMRVHARSKNVAPHRAFGSSDFGLPKGSLGNGDSLLDGGQSALAVSFASKLWSQRS